MDYHGVIIPSPAAGALARRLSAHAPRFASREIT